VALKRIVSLNSSLQFVGNVNSSLDFGEVISASQITASNLLKTCLDRMKTYLKQKYHNQCIP